MTAPANVDPLLVDLIVDGKGSPRAESLHLYQTAIDLRGLMDLREAMIVASDSHAAWSEHHRMEANRGDDR